MTKILVVEDEDNYRQFLKKVVGKKYSCETASNGNEAKAKILNGNYDIIIHDLRLPGIQGNDLIHFIRKSVDKDIVNIVITGFENDWNPLEATSEDIFYYLKKGEFKPEDLIKILGNAEKIRKIRLIEQKNIHNLINLEKKSYFSKLAISIAHEINNPLQSMMLITHMLKEDLKKIEKGNGKSLSEEISILEKSIDRIKQTVELIINFNREDIKEGEKSEIQWIIKQSISFIRPIAKEKGIKINEPIIGKGMDHINLNDTYLFAFLYLLLEIVDFGIKDISINVKKIEAYSFVKIVSNIKKNANNKRIGLIKDDFNFNSSVDIFKKLGSEINMKISNDKIIILVKLYGLRNH